MNCRGSYRCHNVHCKNLLEAIETIYVLCEARLILEQDLKKEIVTCKHYSSHTCPSKNIQQIDCSEIKEVAKGFPKLTREGYIGQKTQNCLEEKSYNSQQSRRQEH